MLIMIKYLLFVLLLIWGNIAFSDHHKLTKSVNQQNYQGNLRLFFRHADFRYLVEYTNEQQSKQDDYQHLQILMKYRLTSSSRFGVGAMHSFGLRHNEDWLGDNKEWQSTESRGETMAILHSSYRTLLPSEMDGVFEVRLNYMYNTFNQNQFILLRPGISWILNNKNILFTQLEGYFPLNYANNSLYEWWSYVSNLHTFHKKFKAGPFISYGERTWLLDDDSYSKHQIVRVGGTFNFYF